MEALGGGDSKQLGIFKDKGTGEVAGLLVYEGSPGSYGTPEEVRSYLKTYDVLLQRKGGSSDAIFIGNKGFEGPQPVAFSYIKRLLKERFAAGADLFESSDGSAMGSLPQVKAYSSANFLKPDSEKRVGLYFEENVYAQKKKAAAASAAKAEKAAHALSAAEEKKKAAERAEAARAKEAALKEARRAAYANGEELPPAPADAPKVMKPPPALPAAVVAFGGNPKGWSAVKNVVSESIAAHHQKATEEVSVQNKKLQGFLEAAGLKHHYDKFLEFGIDSVADALDPFITNDETLTDEIGMNAEETAAFHKQCKVARALTAAF